MTDTGQVPGEGLPEDAVGEAVAQPPADLPGGPAAQHSVPSWEADPAGSHGGAYGYLDEPIAQDPIEDDEEELLLMPGPQGTWSDPQPVPPQPEPSHQPPLQPGFVQPDFAPSDYPEPSAATGYPPHPGALYSAEPPVDAPRPPEPAGAFPPADGEPHGYPPHGGHQAADDSGSPLPQPPAPDPAEVAQQPSAPVLAAADPPQPEPATDSGGADFDGAGYEGTDFDAAPVFDQDPSAAAAAPEPEPPQPAPPRRPLHMGPPLPDPASSGVSVRSLADRGPATSQPPARTPGHPQSGPEYLDAAHGPDGSAVIPAQQTAESIDAAGAPGVPAAGTAWPAAPGGAAPHAPAPEPSVSRIPRVDSTIPAQGEGRSSVASIADLTVPPPADPEPGPLQDAQAPVAAAPPADQAPPSGDPIAPAEPAAPAPEHAPQDPPAARHAQPAPEFAFPEAVPGVVPGVVAEDLREAVPAEPVRPQDVQPAALPPTDAPQPEFAPSPVPPSAPDGSDASDAPPIEPTGAEPTRAEPPLAAEPFEAIRPEPHAPVAAPDGSDAPAIPVEPPVSQPPVTQPPVEHPAQPAQPVHRAEPAAPTIPAEQSARTTEPEPEPTVPTAEPATPPTAPEVPVERAEPAPAADGYDSAVRDAVHRVIRERRDIRNGFRSDPIPHEVLLRVLEAAHTAPSVGHSQPWDFVVIRSAATRERMHELATRQREAYAASLPKARAKQFRELKIEAILETPVNIVVTADPTRGGRHTLGRHTQPQMAPYSAALAVENLWLAARAEGLGVGWVSFFDERQMVRELGLPEHLEVVAYLCIGYVDEFPEEPELTQAGWSQRRPLSWVVHDEEYGNRALPGEEPHDLLDETLRGIRPLDAKALGEAWERQKRMTKPAGALGMLEIISAQLSGLSRQCPPPIPEPAALAIFAGDHGVHAQGVTSWPQEVTAQMVANFLGGGAVCNAFANQVGAEICVVDVGVASELPGTPGLVPRKVRPGTADFTAGPAMTRDEALRGVEVGIETARDLVAAGNKALLTGEMGVANTTASAALIAVYTGLDPAEVTGRGTGINDEMHARKVDVVRRALDLHRPDPADPIGVLAMVGGLEHAAMVGLLLGAAALRTPVILDGVSAGAAALLARAIAPEVLAACIAGHRSAEPGHVAALTKLGLRPLIDLDLRLGEGTGALLALPLVQSAARVMHEVATFDSAGVTEKS